MKKAVMIFLGISLLMVSGCSKEEDASYLNDGYDNVEYESADLADVMEVSNVSTRNTGVLHYIMGEIKNTSGTAIDEIGDLAIFDEAGKLMNVKKIHVELEPYGTMYFEELVGQNVQANSVKLSGF